MRNRLPVIVPSSEISADATLIMDGNQAIVAVHPGQTFGSATAAVWAVLREDFPHLHPDQVRSMVREAMPELQTMDDIIGVGVSPPPVERSATPARRPDPHPFDRLLRRAVRRALVAATAAAVCVGIGWLAHDFNLPPQPTAPATKTDPDGPAYSGDPAFRQFAAAGQMRCETIGPLQARCTDVDHLVMFSEAAISPSSIAYSFSYGSERIYVMAFPTPKHAAEWSAEDSAQSSLPNLSVVDRFVFWGTDAPRLQEYRQLVVEASGNQAKQAADGSTGMPDRLAVLAIGTLGLSVDKLTKLESGSLGPTPMLTAVRLVLGGSSGTDQAALDRVLDDGAMVTSLLGGTRPASPLPEPTGTPSSALSPPPPSRTPANAEPASSATPAPYNTPSPSSSETPTTPESTLGAGKSAGIEPPTAMFSPAPEPEPSPEPDPTAAGSPAPGTASAETEQPEPSPTPAPPNAGG